MSAQRRLFSLAFLRITRQGRAAASGGGCDSSYRNGNGGYGLWLLNLGISDFVTEVVFTENLEQSRSGLKT